MRRLLFATLLIVSSFSQRVIDIYHLEDNTAIGQIEKQLIDNIFELHNKISKEKFEIKHHIVADFKDLITTLAALDKSKANTSMVLGEITITEERRKSYDFSNPYIPSREAIISTEDVTAMNYGKNVRIGYLKNSIYEGLAARLKERHIFESVGFDDYEAMEKSLLSGKLNYFLEDNIMVWNHEKLHMVAELPWQNGEGIGIAYVKGSDLKKKFDHVLRYFLKSEKFNQLVFKLYGKEVRDYFKRALLANK